MIAELPAPVVERLRSLIGHDSREMPVPIASAADTTVFRMPGAMGIEISYRGGSLGWIPAGEYHDTVLRDIDSLNERIASGDIDEEDAEDEILSIMTLPAPTSVN